MSDYTLLRVSVDADAVATVLDTIPGVSVVEDGPHIDVLPDRETADASEAATDTTEPPFEPPEDATPAWREYGLLGVGASLVMLGIATVGIWWYRHRQSDELAVEGAETPAPVDHDTDGQTVLGDEMPDADDEAPGRTEDREAVEWTPRTENVSTEGETSDPSIEPAESAPEPPSETDEPETTADPRDQVDIAPLLGVVFLAVSGAVVRWVQRDGDAE